MDLNKYSDIKHPSGFLGKTNLKLYYPRVSTKQIDDALSSQNTYTQMRQAKKPTKYNPSYTWEPGDHMEMDLFQIDTLKNYNKGISFYFIFIDSFSRYCWSRPLRKKTAAACLQALKSILDEIPFRVQRIVCDDGSEYRGVFNTFLMKNGIEKTIARQHAAYCERVIQTLKNILSKAMKEKETLKHYDIFDDVVENYNNRRHRMIKMRPIDALDPENLDRVRYENVLNWRKSEKGFRSKKRIKFKVGELVRPQKKRHTWARSFHQVFESEIYRIKKVHDHLPVPMYTIETLEGQVVKQKKYSSELQKVHNLQDLRIEKVFYNKKKTDPDTKELNVLVKYVELPSKYNEYVPLALLKSKKRERRRGKWS